MNRNQFELAVEEALTWVPPIIRDALENLAVIVEERPSQRDREEVGLSREDYLFGLFRGIPITQRSFFERGGHLPNEIILFRGELEDCCPTEEELTLQISLTLIHEIGHYLGLNESQLRELEAEAISRLGRGG